MSKKKKCKQRAVRHNVYLPRTNKVIIFGTTKREDTTKPFCAYYGANGEICPATTGLEVVLSIPSIPPVRFLACPLHYGIVYKQTEELRKNISLGE